MTPPLLSQGVWLALVCGVQQQVLSCKMPENRMGCICYILGFLCKQEAAGEELLHAPAAGLPHPQQQQPVADAARQQVLDILQQVEAQQLPLMQLRVIMPTLHPV
jgi:hypothetical protein